MFRKLNAILAFLTLLQILIQNIEGQQQPENRTLEENLDAYSVRLNRAKRYVRFKVCKGCSADVKGWNKKYIKYKITKYTKQLSKKTVDRIIRKAFDLWQKPSKLIFKQVTSGYVDIHIKFLRGLGVAGLASSCQDKKLGVKCYIWGDTDFLNHGTIIFNEDKDWRTQPPYRQGKLPWTAAHEIGHVLGLKHSSVKDAVMFKYLDLVGLAQKQKYLNGKIRLHRDDKQGIRAIMKGIKRHV